MRDCLLHQIRHAVDAGVDIVQLREHDLDARALFHLAGNIVGLTRGSRTRVVVNDRIDVALAAGADGVHLRGDGLHAAIVRRIAPAGFLIGRSVHAVTEAVSEAEGADYLVAGTIWPTPSKDAEGPLLGLDGLTHIVKAVGIPVLAIGGVSLVRLSQVAQTGAAGAAAIGLFMADPADTKNGCRARALHAVAQQARAAWADQSQP
jgi:thiamine-phosphate pyrophosphorylase